MNTIRIGRFAPSPTGPLHIGSLVTALASWLDARANGHLWYVRIEDVDHAREEPGASELILEQLQMHGLHWDHWTGEGADARGVLFQQRREAAYLKALIALIAAGRAYPCTCSRKRLQYAVENGKTKHNADGEILYPGFCRPASILTCSLDEAAQLFNLQSETGTSWRFLNPNGDDFVLRRADGYWAYHLATVVDDSFQCITHTIFCKQRRDTRPCGWHSAVVNPLYSMCPWCVTSKVKNSPNRLAPLHCVQITKTLLVYNLIWPGLTWKSACQWAG